MFKIIFPLSLLVLLLLLNVDVKPKPVLPASTLDIETSLALVVLPEFNTKLTPPSNSYIYILSTDYTTLHVVHPELEVKLNNPPLPLVEESLVKLGISSVN